MSDILVIGVDPSSAKLAATVAPYGREPEVTLHKTTLSRDKTKACSHAYTWMSELVRDHRDVYDVYVFLELPVLGRGGPGSTIPQARINGALTAAATMAGAVLVDVNNAHCKKVVIGRGNADKEAIAAWVKEAWPHVYELAGRDQDLLDSAMIYLYGKQTIKRMTKMKNSRRIVTPIRRNRGRSEAQA